MIDSSEKCKRQLVFEFQSARVYEKRSKSRFNKLISPVPWHSVKSRFHSTVELHQLMTSWSTNAVKPLLSSVHLFACSLKTLKFCDIYPRDLLLWTLRLCKQYLLCCHSVWTMTNMTKIF